MSPLKKRLFDLFAFILIVFPILGGGLWIIRPHFKFELTELAVPTLGIFAIALLWHIRAEESRNVQLALRIFEKWRRALSRHSAWTLGLGTLFVASLWAFSSLRRHWNLESNSFDLGIFTNTMWNLTHGNGYVSSIKGGINLFADHQSPIFWAVAPIFAIFPHPETLLVIQAIVLALGAGAVYVIAKQYRRDDSAPNVWWLAAIPLLYWAYLPIRRANAFDFHPEVFMLPLFLWAIAGIQSRGSFARFLGWIAFLAALGCKESAGPIAAGIGLAWFLGAAPNREPKKAIGILAALFGVTVFLFDLKVVPSLLGGQYVYGSLYSHLSQGPLEWMHSLFGMSRWKFLFATLAPLGFLPLFAPRVLVAALPAYLMLFLTEGDGRLNPSFHYAIEVAVGLFWALAASSPALSSATLFKRIKPAIWILFWALLSFGRSEIYWVRKNEPTEHTRWLTGEMLRCLAPDTRMTASSPLVPQVATRQWIQQIPDLTAGTDCVWIDDSVKSWPLNSQERDAWEKRLTETEGFQKFYECGPTRVYQRQSLSGACLRCLPLCPNPGISN